MTKRRHPAIPSHFVTPAHATHFVTPAHAGVQAVAYFVVLDSGFRRNDEFGVRRNDERDFHRNDELGRTCSPGATRGRLQTIKQAPAR